MKEHSMRTSSVTNVFSTIGLAANVVALVTSVLAFGLPYWVHYDKTFYNILSDAQTTESVRLVYTYGFWRYCNGVTSKSSILSSCAAAKTSSGKK